MIISPFSKTAIDCPVDWIWMKYYSNFEHVAIPLMIDMELQLLHSSLRFSQVIKNIGIVTLSLYKSLADGRRTTSLNPLNITICFFLSKCSLFLYVLTLGGNVCSIMSAIQLMYIVFWILTYLAR